MDSLKEYERLLGDGYTVHGMQTLAQLSMADSLATIAIKLGEISDSLALVDEDGSPVKTAAQVLDDIAYGINNRM